MASLSMYRPPVGHVAQWCSSSSAVRGRVEAHGPAIDAFASGWLFVPNSGVASDGYVPDADPSIFSASAVPCIVSGRRFRVPSPRADLVRPTPWHCPLDPGPHADLSLPPFPLPRRHTGPPRPVTPPCSLLQNSRQDCQTKR